MGSYIIRRLFWALVTLLGITVVVFFILHLSGDPTYLMVPMDATAEDVARLRHAYGFDQPLVMQYWSFLKGIVGGSFGASLRYHQDAMAVVLERVPATLELALVSILITVLVAFPLGILAALKPNTAFDSLATGTAALGQAVPGFFLGIMMIYLFAVKLQILPAFGRENWTSYIMPGITLGVFSAPPITRLLRSSLLEVLNKEYIKTARAKGLSDRAVIIRHALRNALIPVITVLGVQLGTLLGGSVITETVFAWPGMGRLMVQAIFNRDYPVVQAAVLFSATLFLLINLAVDLVYAWLDPRIRLR